MLFSPPRVARSLDTKMDVTNLARVFGPTIVGHAVPDPDPLTILHDTKRQPRVEPEKDTSKAFKQKYSENSLYN